MDEDSWQAMQLDALVRERDQAMSEISNLRAALGECVKVLEWYGDAPNHDRARDPGEVSEFGCGCCAGTIDPDGINDFDTGVQGKRARDTLARVRGKAEL